MVTVLGAHGHVRSVVTASSHGFADLSGTRVVILLLARTHLFRNDDERYSQLLAPRVEVLCSDNVRLDLPLRDVRCKLRTRLIVTGTCFRRFAEQQCMFVAKVFPACFFVDTASNNNRADFFNE